MSNVHETHNLRLIRWLTFLMFTMFAMTTDAVGVIIPEIIKDFGLSLTQASAFHYAPMIAIAFSGIAFGFLADKLGRKYTILTGLGIFAVACFLFSLGKQFEFFIALLLISGCAIGIFKTGALALIGDISENTHEHTRTMNTVEGFFGVGAIIGPALVAYLLAAQVSWTYLYLVAGGICVLLMLIASRVQYPHTQVNESTEKINVRRTLTMLRNPYATGFSLMIALYVATEVAIYVWMPTFLKDYNGDWQWLATYALTIFFVLRAGGRFLGAWILLHCEWSLVMAIFSVAIFLCFLGSAIGGPELAVFLFPLSGLFMSMIYPTLNSKGISCFDKHEHGSVAGVILFFTAVAAALGPLLMGLTGDLLGHVKYGFYLATGFSALLCIALCYNLLYNPAEARLNRAQLSSTDEMVR
ncbi:MFS transporter [Cellvibrio fibrivorans]|uniref:Fucose permease n=1 Tax=Cellvibrio fibrivorans TaxID=126350 RepID=A0ABU1V3G5_9GAMM|nr:MFS transporter [Cellvibrio fibrivorans]MDR7091996.1 fucose permease [Cellvibrio fibrivorans]